jgi:TatD DNase family protein
MPKLIDTHSHPYWDKFDADRSEMMERTWGICEAIISVGSTVADSHKSIALAQTDPRIFASVGVHPHDATEDPHELIALAAQPKVVAIGECGLDFKPYQDQPIDQEKQKEVFRFQLELAKAAGKPIIIHARDSWVDLIPLLKEIKPNSGLIHSWTGGLKEANEIFNLGLHISFSGMLTYPANDHIRAVAAMAPAERILVETDSPFLPPQALRGQRNEPGNVRMVAEKLAEIRGVSLEEIASITTANARRLFNLPIL